MFENDTDSEGLVIYVDDSRLPTNNGDSRDLSIILEHIRSNIPQFQLFEERNWKYFYIFRIVELFRSSIQRRFEYPKRLQMTTTSHISTLWIA